MQSGKVPQKACSFLWTAADSSALQIPFAHQCRYFPCGFSHSVSAVVHPVGTNRQANFSTATKNSGSLSPMPAMI